MPDFSLIIPAFFAGLITFLAPCTLPLVPAYLGFISGVSVEDLKKADPETAKKIKKQIFFNGLFFVIGFSIIFIALGTLIAFIGATVLAPYRVWLTRVGGVFVILFGLFMLGTFKMPFLGREHRFKTPTVFATGRPINSLILGSSFALGWTPCVGPVLGSILLLASTTTTAFQGAILLSVFSLGLAVPFLVIAAAIGSASKYVEKFIKYTKIISIIGGVFLILLGVLLLFDRVVLLISWGFQLLQFFNYEKIINFL